MASILVIDDDPQIQLLLQHALEAEGHVVLQASNGRQGIRIAELTAPDLVITDVFMPDTDGLEVTKALRREVPATRTIAFSGGIAGMDHVDAAKMLGVHRTVRKPFLLAELFDAVQRELQIKSSSATQTNL